MLKIKLIAKIDYYFFDLNEIDILIAILCYSSVYNFMLNVEN